MRRTLAKIITVSLALLLLLGVPGFVGCGDNGNGDGGKIQIPIGIMTDFTGPACFAVRPMMDAFRDAFKLAQEEGKFPEGVEVKWYTYDQKTDPARVPSGYKWLQGQGVLAMNIISPTDRSILANDFMEDGMPVWGSSVDEGSPAHEWTYNMFGSNGHEVEAVVEYVIDTWDDDTRVPKIGHQSWTAASGEFHQIGFERMMAWPEYADKWEFGGWSRAPMGTASWTSEVEEFMDCDYIFFSTVGAMTTTFIAESRGRGYTGAYISGTNSFGGYWDMVVDAVPTDQLYDCYCLLWQPWVTAGTPLCQEVIAGTEKFHPGEDWRLRNSGTMSGYIMAWYAIQALNDAIEAVGGAENLTSVAIRDASRDVKMTVEGFEYPWQMYHGYHAYTRQLLPLKYNPTLEYYWEDTGHGWVTPHSLVDLQPLN